MAKGQLRSNREAKKPKKTASEKPKPGATSAFAEPSGSARRPGSKKT